MWLEETDPMSETLEVTSMERQSAPAIETFAAQRETAIALRTSTAQMRIAKLRKLEAAS
jgi:hypothetical protein